MLVLGGSATVTDLTGMSTIAVSINLGSFPDLTEPEISPDYRRVSSFPLAWLYM